MLLHPLRKSPRPSRPAFTLIELLTVIAIIGILAAIIIPVVGRVRDSARNVKCTSNLKQIGIALQLYAAENRGLYPAISNAPGTQNPSGGTWMAEISPYVFRASGPNGAPNTLDIKRVENVFHCPTYDLIMSGKPGGLLASTGGAAYGLNSQAAGTGSAAYLRRLLASLVKSPSRTILAGDSSATNIDVQASPWPLDPASPEGYRNCSPERHGGNSNYLFCDGHVSRLTPDQALAALLRKNF